MKNNNYWAIALVLSFTIHFVFFTGSLLPIFNKSIKAGDKKEIKKIKVAIRKTVKQAGKSITQQVNLENTKITVPPPYIKNVMAKLMGQDIERPALPKAQILEKNTNEIIISDKLQSAALKRNPSYMSYYNGLRSKLYDISRRNYKGKYNGEISLTFILLRDGNLEYVKGEGQNQELIDLALKIVKEAAPFQSFPQELKGQSCQFGISILFKNN